MCMSRIPTDPLPGAATAGAKPPTAASRTPYLDSASVYQRSSVPGESSTSTRTRALRSAGGWVRDVPTRIDGTFEVPLFARAGAIVPEMAVDEQTLNALGER